MCKPTLLACSTTDAPRRQSYSIEKEWMAPLVTCIQMLDVVVRENALSCAKGTSVDGSRSDSRVCTYQVCTHVCKIQVWNEKGQKPSSSRVLGKGCKSSQFSSHFERVSWGLAAVSSGRLLNCTSWTVLIVVDKKQPFPIVHHRRRPPCHCHRYCHRHHLFFATFPQFTALWYSLPRQRWVDQTSAPLGLEARPLTTSMH